MAKDWFNDHPQYAVIGGYMSPVADAYGKKGLLSGDHRRAMCHQAALEHDEVMVDEWESLKSEYTTTVNVLKHFSDELNKNNKSSLPSESDRILLSHNNALTALISQSSAAVRW